MTEIFVCNCNLQHRNCTKRWNFAKKNIWNLTILQIEKFYPSAFIENCIDLDLSNKRVRHIEFQESNNVPARKLIVRYTINKGHSVASSTLTTSGKITDQKKVSCFSYVTNLSLLEWLLSKILTCMGRRFLPGRSNCSSLCSAAPTGGGGSNSALLMDATVSLPDFISFFWLQNLT